MPSHCLACAPASPSNGLLYTQGVLASDAPNWPSTLGVAAQKRNALPAQRFLRCWRSLSYSPNILAALPEGAGLKPLTRTAVFDRAMHGATPTLLEEPRSRSGSSHRPGLRLEVRFEEIPEGPGADKIHNVIGIQKETNKNVMREHNENEN